MHILYQFQQQLANRVIAFRLGAFIFVNWGVFAAIGVLFSSFIIAAQFLAFGIDSFHFSSLFLGTTVLGILGARLLWILLNFKLVLQNPSFQLRQNRFSFYGGFTLGFLYLVIYVSYHQVPILPLLDSFALAIPLGHAIGRLGCLAHGCCHGGVCEKTYAIKVTNPKSVVIRIGNYQLGSSLFPTQSIAALGNFVLFVLLNGLFYRVTLPFGSIAALYLILYSLMRFLIDFTRGEHYERKILSISIHQMFSILFIVIGIGLLFYIQSLSTPSVITTTTLNLLLIPPFNIMLSILLGTFIVFIVFSINYKEIGRL